MKFNIVQMTQNALITYLIHDPVRTLLYALEALGHDVTFHQNQFLKDRINIVVTGYRMPEELIHRIIRLKIPYIVYQTEVFSEQGLNFIPNLGSMTYGLHIQGLYLKLLEKSLMVWECFEFNRTFLQQHGIASEIITHGYIPQLEGGPKKEPLYDVCFFGSLTKYRTQVFSELKKLSVSVKVLGLEPPFVRDELLRCSKINLSLRANDTTMSHIPHFRILTALYHNTMTISEYAKGQEWIEPMMHCVEPDPKRLVEDILSILEGEVYTAKVEQYKNHFQRQPMTDIVQRLVKNL